MSDCTPFLSVVVAARNDDHGGSLLRRMQTFLNCWIGQSKRHGLRSELIVVEWNPPADRPPLREALAWPADLASCSVRFVVVPPELHQQFRYADVLPLYQMIAKNVGIRRARAPFVLATNIDILFSEALISYLAEGRLQRGRMYRIDRLDVSTDVPVDAPVEEQLRYCESHLIRCNTRYGTFALTRGGQRAIEAVDIALPGSVVTFGRGWFPVEPYGALGVFRWLENDAEVTVKIPDGPSKPFSFALEPGPSAGNQPLILRAVGSDEQILAEAPITGPTEFRVQPPEEKSTVLSFQLRVSGGGLPVPHDPRILNLRVLRCGWGPCAHPAPLRSAIERTGTWKDLMHVLTDLAHRGTLDTALPEDSRLRQLIRAYVDSGGVTGTLTRALGRKSDHPAPAPAIPSVLSPALDKVAHPAFLHTNGCGDFTLMARDHWFDLRGYPEFDLFSMNLDSVLCHSAYHAGFQEEVLLDPLRIYHIEHGTGSGWTPEGQVRLFDRLKAQGIAWLDYREFIDLAEQMAHFHSPMISNPENWGFGATALKEIVLSQDRQLAATDKA